MRSRKSPVRLAGGWVPVPPPGEVDMLRSLIAAAFVAALSLSANAADVSYPLDGDNTKITFVGKKPDGKHEGGFKKVSGTATLTDGKLETLKAEIEIDMDSIFT